jgi:hypothetical protein
VNQIQAEIFSALGNYPALATLVGTRIYPDEAPQAAAKPFVVWQEISDQESNDLSGSAETGGTHNYRIQITYWAADQTKSRDGAKQVRLAMSAAAGFKSLHLDTRSLGKDEPTKSYGMQSDFSVWLRTA